MAEPESGVAGKKHFLRSTAAFLEGTAGLAVIALLAWQLVVVLLRYVFSLGSPWASDLLSYLFFFVVVLPLTGVLIGNTSVRVDVVSRGFSQPAVDLIDRLALLLFGFSADWVAWTSLPTTLNSWRLLESSPNLGGLPGYFILKSFVTATFAALSVVALIMALCRQPYSPGSKL